MADDPSKRDYRDKTRINMKQAHEIAYWKERFGVSAQALGAAVQRCWYVSQEGGRVFKGKGTIG